MRRKPDTFGQPPAGAFANPDAWLAAQGLSDQGAAGALSGQALRTAAAVGLTVFVGLSLLLGCQETLPGTDAGSGQMTEIVAPDESDDDRSEDGSPVTGEVGSPGSGDAAATDVVANPQEAVGLMLGILGASAEPEDTEAEDTAEGTEVEALASSAASQADPAPVWITADDAQADGNRADAGASGPDAQVDGNTGSDGNTGTDDNGTSATGGDNLGPDSQDDPSDVPISPEARMAIAQADEGLPADMLTEDEADAAIASALDSLESMVGIAANRDAVSAAEVSALADRPNYRVMFAQRADEKNAQSRAAEVAVYRYDTKALSLTRVDLATGATSELTPPAGYRPPLLPQEVREASRVARSHADARDALAAAGLNPDTAATNGLLTGQPAQPGSPCAIGRCLRLFFFDAAHRVPEVSVIVDVASLRVVDVESLVETRSPTSTGAAQQTPSEGAQP